MAPLKTVSQRQKIPIRNIPSIDAIRKSNGRGTQTNNERSHSSWTTIVIALVRNRKNCCRKDRRSDDLIDKKIELIIKF